MGRLHTKSNDQIQDERKKLMYTRRPVIETLALVSYELQMFQRQFAPRPEGIQKQRSKSKSASKIWGVDLHKLRDVRKPKQRILGLTISKDDIPSLKMADTSDSDSDSSDEENGVTRGAARRANHHGSSGSRSGTTPHTAYSSMLASGFASQSTSRGASRPLTPIGETHRKVHHRHRKAPKWQKAIQKKNASVAFEAQSSEVETKAQQPPPVEAKTPEEEAIAAIDEDPGQAAVSRKDFD
ncbi:hypothetical protein DUNSADRAFT_17728 [Dunaliella salina]|uniref:Encoded protein n=1 Tax=Dunaliella salina TaxID=3046 RepID=A0ABQ7GZU1_DUNSA|nr:hypothetical protein DUNSADRAFT_17728 [Dunaliella salina]|eukprot:KAF5840127.1 hypothetical protein DUNSADRAFT_17728 [Dunaliella salina]